MTVDGEVVGIGSKVDAAAARIAVDGVPLPTRPGIVAYLVYKPVGVISTANDPQGRPTVVDLVPDEPRVYPVGRLDGDSEGLLMLTNDGDLTLRVTHPRYGVTKTYVALVDGDVPDRAVRRLVSGVQLGDGPAAAAAARRLDRARDASLVEVVMNEGRNREVRRMFDAIGHPVRRLTRTAIGPIVDRDLAPGTWRDLTVDEYGALYRASGAAWEDGALHDDEAR